MTDQLWLRLGQTDALGSTEVKLIFGRMTDVMGVAYFLVIVGTVLLILAASSKSRRRPSSDGD